MRHAPGHKLALFVLLGLFFLLVLGAFFQAVFGYLYDLQEFPLPFKLFVAEKLMVMVFLTLFSMLLLSAMLSTLDILYLSRDLSFLLASPLPLGRIYGWKMVEVGAVASAMVVFFSFPALFSYCWYFAPAPGQVLGVALLFLLFTSSGVLLGMLPGTLIPALFSVKRLQPVLSVFAVLLLSLLVVMLRLLRPERFLNPDEIGDMLRFMGGLDLGGMDAMPFARLARGLTQAANREWAGLAFTAALFLLFGGVLLASVLLLQRRLFLPVHRKLGQSGRGLYRSSWAPLPGRVHRLLRRKELKTLWRTPAQWSQLLIIGALVAVFVINMKLIPMPIEAIKRMVAFMNLGLAAFIVAGLNSRFSFPAVAAEGPGLVHVLASPLPRRDYYRFKLRFYLMPQLLLGFGLFAVADLTLHFDGFLRLTAALFLPPVIVLVAVLAIFFGVRVGDIAPLSVQHVVVSRQGIAYMLWSLVAVVGALALFVRPVLLYYWTQFRGEPAPLGEIAAWYGGYWLLCLGLAASLHRSARRHWEEKEY